MIILSHGQIVAEGTILELQKKFVNKTLFEIVARGNRIDLQKVVRLVDPSCELIQDDPVEVSEKKVCVFYRKRRGACRKGSQDPPIRGSL